MDEFTVVESKAEQATKGLEPKDNYEPITSKVTIKGDIENLAQSLPFTQSMLDALDLERRTTLLR
jgi:hypothetical protein